MFQTGGFPDLDLSFLFCPFLSFLRLSRFFWDFPDLLGDGLGIFPICPFPLSRPIKSTYEEQSRKGPRHNLDLSRKSGKHPGLETPRFSFSQELCGEVHPETSFSVSSVQCSSLYRPEHFSRAKRCRERGGRGVASKGAKRKKGGVKTGQLLSNF